MNTPTGENMFEITLSQEGISYLLRICRIVQWTFLLALLLYTSQLVMGSITFIQRKEFDTKGVVERIVQFRIGPLVLIITSAMAIVEISFFFRFFQLCKKAIETKQAELFNHSFKWLFWHTILALILFIINLPFSAYYCYIAIKGLAKAFNPA